MRLSLIIGILSLSGLSFSQNIEASVSAYGFGNYTPGANSSATTFKDQSYSSMASFMFRRPWVRGGNAEVKLEAGVGISFTQYKGNWEEYVQDRLVAGQIVQSDEIYRYSATMNALGLEITPIIATFWKHLELRTSLFLGTNITDGYVDEYGRSLATLDQNDVLLFQYGIIEEVPTEFSPSYVLHWNSRVAFKFNLNSFSIAPFYQYSRGLTKEGQSISLDNITSYRNHFGLTFGYNFDR